MNLTLFFRLILMSIFQKMVVHNKLSYRGNMSYNNQLFYCPKVVAKDGFTVSLQINNSNYCESNNGYKTLGDTIVSVEFGFPTINEPLMWEYAEGWGYGGYDEDGEEIPFDKTSFNVTNTVGRIPVEVMEKVFIKHGGIDWEKTISAEAFDILVNK